jgi:sugar phosphate isomerase/epimerase
MHLKPGEGDLDFGDLFARVEGGGFTGLYTAAFGSLDDMLGAREGLVAAARGAGVATG